jgi:hypothetical protein
MRFRGNVAAAPRLLKEHLDPQSVVHFLPCPTGYCRLPVDAHSLLLVIRKQLPPVGADGREIGSCIFEGPAIRSEKSQRAIVESLNHNFALMYLSVMKTAELYQVGELSLASVRPMVDMMRVNVARV